MFGIFILIDKFKKVIFVTLDIVESEGQLWLLQKAYGICRFVIRSILNGTLAITLNYWKVWKVLALEIKYHHDTKRSGENNWM